MDTEEKNREEGKPDSGDSQTGKEKVQVHVPNTSPADAQPQQSEPAKPIDYRSQLQTMPEEELASLFHAVEEREFYKSSLQRVQADYLNYQKRVERDRADMMRYAAQGTLVRFLEVMDHLDRAIGMTKETQDFNSFCQGICLVQQLYFKALTESGVKPIVSVGCRFDPLYHQALMRREDPQLPEMTILEEYQKGYLLYDRVLRPSRVAISCLPKPPAAGEEKGEEKTPEKTGEKDREH